MRDDDSTLACFCLIQLNQLPCSYCLPCVRQHIVCDCLPTVSACLFEIISPCLWDSVFLSAVSVSVLLPPAEQDSLPLLVSVIFHLVCSNLCSRTVEAPSSAGRVTEITFSVTGWYEALLEDVPVLGLGVESKEFVADGRKWSYWCLQRCDKSKCKNPAEKKILKGKDQLLSNTDAYCAKRLSLLKLLCQQSVSVYQMTPHSWKMTSPTIYWSCSQRMSLRMSTSYKLYMFFPKNLKLDLIME